MLFSSFLRSFCPYFLKEKKKKVSVLKSLFLFFWINSVLRVLDHGLTLALILIIVITSKECCTTSPVADLFLKQI